MNPTFRARVLQRLGLPKFPRYDRTVQTNLSRRGLLPRTYKVKRSVVAKELTALVYPVTYVTEQSQKSEAATSSFASKCRTRIHSGLA